MAGDVSTDVVSETTAAAGVTVDGLLIKDGAIAASGVPDGADATAIHDDTAGEISAITEKVTPALTDVLIIEDSADSNNKKRVQIDNLPDGLHAATHDRGATDEVDGDVLDIDFTPSVYTPATTPPEVTDVNELSAHLQGIDDQLTDKTASNHLFVEPDSSGPAEVFNNDVKVVALPDGATKGVVVTLPISGGADLAINPTLTIGLVITGAGAASANVKIDLDIKYIAPGELTSKADDENLSNIVAITNTIDTVHTTTFTINASLAAAGDIASLNITREGGDAADTFTGEIGIIKTVLVISSRQ